MSQIPLTEEPDGHRIEVEDCLEGLTTTARGIDRIEYCALCARRDCVLEVAEASGADAV